MKKFNFIINGNKYEVKVEETDKNLAEVTVNGSQFNVEIEPEKKNSIDVVSPTLRRPAPKSAAAQPSAAASTAKTLASELPGSITKVLVKTGDNVKRGDVLLVIESMKMENNIMAETDAVVGNIYVEAGQSVMQGDKLMDIQGTGTTVVSEPAPAPKAEQTAPKAAPKATATAGAESIKSPLPGSVIKVPVKAGDAVKRGDILLVMESMKMENNIMAERDCVIKKVHITEGQSVMQDDLLVDIE